MPKLVIVHDVEDIDRWLKGKSERADAIGGMGGKNVSDHVARDGSKTVAITAEVGNVDAVLTQIESPPAELLAAMQSHGVVPPLKVFVEP